MRHTTKKEMLELMLPAKQKPITVGELRCMRDALENQPTRPFLYCQKCCGEFSADPSDYFAADAATVIKHCRKPMRLVRRVTSLVEVA